jgi:hypothetical protein
MNYIKVQASLNSAGSRDIYADGFYVADLSELGISDSLVERLKYWISQYDTAFYSGFVHGVEIIRLDSEGLSFAYAIKTELKDVKVAYVSNATMSWQMV